MFRNRRYMSGGLVLLNAQERHKRKKKKKNKSAGTLKQSLGFWTDVS